MEGAIEVAAEVVRTFEELLSRKEIKIPSRDREGDEDEACLFGPEYRELEERVLEILSGAVERWK